MLIFDKIKKYNFHRHIQVLLFNPVDDSFHIDMNIALILIMIPLFLDNKMKEFKLVTKNL